MRYRRIRATGEFNSATRNLLNIADPDSANPAIVFDDIGNRFVGVWTTGAEVRTAAWSSTGAITTSPFTVSMVTGGHSGNPTASFDPDQGNVFAVWEEGTEAMSTLNGRATGNGTFQVRASLLYPGSAGAEHKVIVGDNFFSPRNLTVDIGSLVTWTNEGFNPHTVTSGTPVMQVGMLLDSGTMNRGRKFSFRFTETGSVPYFCRVHGVTQSGTIQVVSRSK